jgi:integrase/recombinase XerD
MKNQKIDAEGGPVKPEDLVQEFIRQIRVERGLALNTQATYRYQLIAYLNFLRARGKAPGDAAREDILAYLESRRGSELRSSSIFTATVAVRQFHRFLLSASHTTIDPTAGMKLPKFKQRLPEPLTVPEMEQLLGGRGTKFHHLRMRAALELLYSSGIRVSEMISLQSGQIRIEDGWARVIGKGSKERLVPISPKAKEALLCYMDARRQRFGDSMGFLFLSSRGKQMNRGEFWRQLRLTAKVSGVTGRIFPHRIRHSTATHLLAGGADIRVLQELLGHNSLTTTQRYAHVTAELLKKTCQQAHPRFYPVPVRGLTPPQ